MRSAKKPTPPYRRGNYERFEERLTLSGHPVAELPPDEESQIPCEQHHEELGPLAPILDVQFDVHAGEIEQHTRNAHQLTGVDYVYNHYGFDGSGQTVAIIDTGIAYDHVALGGGFGTGYRVVGGFDFAESDGDPYDDGPAGFHGTHVAGIVGSRDALHRGVASGVDLVALRVFDDQGRGSFQWVEEALEWVRRHADDFANPITAVNLSLGSAWNSDDLSGWQELEDEMALLKADGIFIAASAGNSFEEGDGVGLSYPAASTSVVPVASVDDDGRFSSFSQRDDRVLAAPGRSVTSTVPDHIYGGDGDFNDFGTLSGTSMTAPYVAGASTLVREAMSFVGLESATQDMIYDLLRGTADRFYDEVTAAFYHRINVGAAISHLMPEDDVGSSESTARELGTIRGETALSGLIGTRTDRDYFRFTAAETGQFSVSFETTHDLELDLRSTEGTGVLQDNLFTINVLAGQAYRFSIGTRGGIGYYEALGSISTHQDAPTEAPSQDGRDGTDLLDLARELDERHGFHSSGHYFDNWAGFGEKWFQGHDTAWFFVTPAGTVFEWNGSRAQASQSEMVAELDASFHADPPKLIEADRGLDEDDASRHDQAASEDAADRDRAAHDEDYANDRVDAGEGETGKSGQDGHERDDRTQDDQGGKREEQDAADGGGDASDGDDLSRGTEGEGDNREEAAERDDRGHGSGQTDNGQDRGEESGAKERAADDSGAQPDLGQRAHQLDQQLGLRFYRSYNPNLVGLGEKWIASNSGQWYFITPDGSFYRWNGNRAGAAMSELVARFDPTFHADPGKLHDAPAPAAMADAHRPDPHANPDLPALPQSAAALLRLIASYRNSIFVNAGTPVWSAVDSHTVVPPESETSSHSGEEQQRSRLRDVRQAALLASFFRDDDEALSRLVAAINLDHDGEDEFEALDALFDWLSDASPGQIGAE